MELDELDTDDSVLEELLDIEEAELAVDEELDETLLAVELEEDEELEIDEELEEDEDASATCILKDLHMFASWFEL